MLATEVFTEKLLFDDVMGETANLIISRGQRPGKMSRTVVLLLEYGALSKGQIATTSAKRRDAY